MNVFAKGWRFLPLLLLILLGYFFWRGLSLDPKNLPSAQIGKAIPTFKLQLLGNEECTLTSKALQGQVYLLNVWASWCNSCAQEQLFLLQLAREGMPIYGLNYKDNSQRAKKWLTEWGDPYRLVGEDPQGKLAIDLGVYGTPETFLVDREGIIRYRYAGVLDEQIWLQEFLPRIQQLRAAG